MSGDKEKAVIEYEKVVRFIGSNIVYGFIPGSLVSLVLIRKILPGGIIGVGFVFGLQHREFVNSLIYLKSKIKI